MIGLNKTTGESITTETDHVHQSVGDIITTPVGSRIMRRSYGSVIPDLIDQPMNARTLARLYAATAAAIINWEPRLKISTIQLHGQSEGKASIEIAGTINGESVSYSVPVTAQNIRTLLAEGQRFIRLLNGIDQTTTLVYSAGDEITLDVYPTAGKTGLPGGCPDLVNNVIERVIFTATDSGVIGNNGSDYFAGIIFRCQINGTVYPLSDEYRVLRHSNGTKAAEWSNKPIAQVVTRNEDTGAWSDAATTYPLSDLMTAIYHHGADNLISAAEKLHAAVHNWS